MFRCHFTRRGHIAMGENLDSMTLNDAIAAGEKMLASSAVEDQLDGIEIWDCAAFLYASSGRAAPAGSTAVSGGCASIVTDGQAGQGSIACHQSGRWLVHSQQIE